MKSLSHLIVGMLMAATIFLSAACEHRDLCYDHSHWTDLKVEFDWSEAPRRHSAYNGGLSLSPRWRSVAAL